MRYHALIAILLPLFSYGQSPGSTASSSSIAGTIEMPSLVDMSISSAVTDKISINNFATKSIKSKRAVILISSIILRRQKTTYLNTWMNGSRTLRSFPVLRSLILLR